MRLLRTRSLPAHRLPWIFGGMLLAAILAASVTAVLVLRQQAIEEWSMHLENLSLILAEHTEQTMMSADLILGSLVDYVGAAGIADERDLRTRMATPEVHRMLRDKASGSPQVATTSIVAPNGDLINFARSYPPPKFSFADRDY